MTMKKETTTRVSWGHELKLACTRRWKEKLAALVLAFFFWNMVKQQIHPTSKKQQDFIEQHGLKEQSGL